MSETRQLIERLRDYVKLNHNHSRRKRCCALAELMVEAADQIEADGDSWRCFHCGDVFTDEAEAREHFGRAEMSSPGCAITLAEFRQMEEQLADLRSEYASVENDARLWHEAEADRRRRIGNVQWWQELDSKQGEIIALQAQIEADAARIKKAESALKILRRLAIAWDADQDLEFDEYMARARKLLGFTLNDTEETILLEAGDDH